MKVLIIEICGDYVYKFVGFGLGRFVSIFWMSFRILSSLNRL